MNKIEIECLENYFNNQAVIPSNMLDDFIIRLQNNWSLYKENPKYKIDFEICLRDFLLKNKKPIKINNYIISDFGKKYLDLFIFNEKIFIHPNYPNYVNVQFINECIDSLNKNNVFPKKTVHLETPKFIRDLTGFQNFKSEEQKICVLGSLKTPCGFTTLVSMSTGGGKSLVTQAVSYKEDCLTVIVVPTISLMIDQVRNAREIIKPKNLDEITYYNSDSNAKEIVNLINNKIVKMLFLSPETLIKNYELRKALENAAIEGYFKNFIIDEAHIIVEWGASFRVDFQCIDAFRKHIIEMNKQLRTFLLSATFSKDTVQLLHDTFSECENWIEIRCESLRKEPRYNIIKASDYDAKKEKQLELIAKLPHPMIIYVHSPEDAENLKKQLQENDLNNIETFTGKTSTKDRDRIIKKWSNSELDIMIATCAFGVGVDKKNVRTVLHLYVPNNPNKFYQEAGRGGRDGNPCLSVLLYTQADIEASHGMVQKTLTTEKLVGRWFSMLNSINTSKTGVDNIVYIDSSTKPNYAESTEYLDFANNQDINWNVYVILLLKRFKKIEVKDVEFDSSKKTYLFKIKVLENELFDEHSTFAKKELDFIRSEEFARTNKEFELMEKMIKDINRNCVSETFCQVYNLVDEYCAGCNSHNEPSFTISKKVVKKSIKYIPIQFYNIENKSVYLMFYKNTNELPKSICEKIDTLVYDGYDYLQNNGFNFNVFSYSEFFSDCYDYPFLYGNKICLVLGEKQFEKKILLDSISKMLTFAKKFNLKLLLLCEQDYFINSNGKKISEFVEGQIVNEYLIEEVLESV